jgi:GMP synthase (glutamine-hydrolysing)
MSHQTIIVLDFGSQFTQLIARRLRELNVYSEILPFNTPIDQIRAKQPAGIILSGGPRSVAEPNAPLVSPALFDTPVPILGICYGMQLMTAALGGTVARSAHREFGQAMVAVDPDCDAVLFADVRRELRVWASHGDHVSAAPPGFTVVATSNSVPIAAMQHPGRQFYGLLFHPEVAHTEQGREILRNFAYNVCGCRGDWTMASFVEESVAQIRRDVGEGRVVLGLSGGVDSTVAALLVHRAIGDRLTCIFVDNGLLRQDEAKQVVERFTNNLQLPLVPVDASGQFLDALRGVTDPEQKRKIIGKTFIDVFEATAHELGHFDFLAQGTLYPTSSRASRSLAPPPRSKATTTSAACRSACGSSWWSRCGSCSRMKRAKSG